MATARPRPPVGEPAAGFEEHGLTWSDTPSRVTISLPMTKERLRALNLRVFTDGNNLTLTSSPATKGKEGTNVLVQVRLYGEVSAAAMEPARLSGGMFSVSLGKVVEKSWPSLTRASDRVVDSDLIERPADAGSAWMCGVLPGCGDMGSCTDI